MALSQRHSHVPTIDYPSSIRSKGILRKGTVTFSTPSKTVAAADSVRRSVSEHKPPACSVAPLLQKSAVLASALTAVLHGDTETQDTTSDLYKFSFSSAKHPQASWTAPRPRTGTQVLRPLALPGSSLSQTSLAPPSRRPERLPLACSTGSLTNSKRTCLLSQRH